MAVSGLPLLTFFIFFLCRKEPVIDYEPQEVAERMSRLKGGRFEDDDEREARFVVFATGFC